MIAMTCGTGRNFSPAVSVSIANVSTEPTHVDAASVVLAILERYRRPDTQLEDLVIHYNCRDSIGRQDPSEKLVPWTATLELPFYDADGETDRASRDRDRDLLRLRHPR